MSYQECRARSRPIREGDPDSHFLCTNDAGHGDPEHTACNGNGRVLARWKDQQSPVEVWFPTYAVIGLDSL